MTHIVHPYSQRLGIIRTWKSRWFKTGDQYKNFLKGDILLREYLEKKLRGNFVSSIDIERNDKQMKVILKTSRAGMIIGRGGDGSTALKDDIVRFLKKNKLTLPEEVRVDIEEVRYPETDAGIVSAMVVEGLERRMPFRRVLKSTAEKVMANREVFGVKITLSGRLGGADMARKEYIKKGRIPLQTLRADVDYSEARAEMAYGTIGVKVWIYKGDIFEDSK